MDQFLIIFILLIIYFLLLFIAKKIGIGRKKICQNCNNCCPDCSSALNRIGRKKIDHIIHHITLRIFDSKRYICNNCGWEGLRWEDKFHPKNIN